MSETLLPIGTWVVFDPSGGTRPDRALVGVVHDHSLGGMIMQTNHPGFSRSRIKPENILHVLVAAPQPKFQAGDLVLHRIGHHQTLRVSGQVRWNGDLETGCFSHRLLLAADGSAAGWTSECFLEAETRNTRLREHATA
jgi:hypothetical protein